MVSVEKLFRSEKRSCLFWLCVAIYKCDCVVHVATVWFTRVETLKIITISRCVSLCVCACVRVRASVCACACVCVPVACH